MWLMSPSWILMARSRGKIIVAVYQFNSEVAVGGAAIEATLGCRRIIIVGATRIWPHAILTKRKRTATCLKY
jgi:hypothetical protein